MGERHVVVCAGEESGDLLGSQIVPAIIDLGFSVLGSGGARMQAAGLQSLVSFEDLAVSGFGDVMLRINTLRSHLKTLKDSITSPGCAGLVCVDYPGFNMRLMREANTRGIPVLYVAPPQIWAWKPERGREFYGKDVLVLFPFELDAWKPWHANAQKIRHPLLDILPQMPTVDSAKNTWVLMPGSRPKAALRNLDAYLRLARELVLQRPRSKAIFAAANAGMQELLQSHLGHAFEVVDRQARNPFVGACGVVAPPGTASLEATLMGLPTLVHAVVDPVTWAMGKTMVRLPHLSATNLLLERGVVREAIFASIPGMAPSAKDSHGLAEWLTQCDAAEWNRIGQDLRRLLDGTPLSMRVAQACKAW